MHTTNRWSAKLKQHLPEARVAGVLADAHGYLVMCPCNHDSGDVQRIHDCLKKAGVVGWNWSAAGRDLKIRAYLPQRWQFHWAHAALLAIFIAALRWKYDIHAS